MTGFNNFSCVLQQQKITSFNISPMAYDAYTTNRGILYTQDRIIKLIYSLKRIITKTEELKKQNKTHTSSPA